jgi:hypothetical protein
VRKIPRVERMTRNRKKTSNDEELLTNFKMRAQKLNIEMSKIMLFLVSFGIPCFADLFCWSAVR